jgi:trehalose 6-phosphate phosphatase
MASKGRLTPHLFENWEHVSRSILGHGRLVMFLDFDGTLVRIAPTPQQVRLEEDTRAALKNLARHPQVTLVIISGRRRAELQRHIGLSGLCYLGLYGWETNGNMSFPYPIREALAATVVDLVARLPENSGVCVEPKGETFSVHLLRARAETQRKVRQILRKVVAPHRGTLKVIANLRDLEVAPVALGDKGVGVKKVLSEPTLRGALPIYFGDDLSDEPGFAAARAGISVLVGKRRPTHAKFFLKGPAEVAEALGKMEEIIRWRQRPRRLSSLASLT